VERLILRGHAAPVSSVQFAFDGNTVLTFSDDGTAKTWDVSKLFGGTRESRIKAACDRLKEIGMPTFTAEEMSRPILQGRAANDNDPCNRKGLLSAAWWRDQMPW
jgi:WD40 repeat protein